MWKVIGSALLIAGLSSLIGLTEINIAMAQSGHVKDPYMLCALHPEAAPCPKIVREAMNKSGPGAEAVKQAYESYVRYLENGHGGLTAADRHYLQRNGIAAPDWLSPVQMAGLHNVINNPALADKAQARQEAVNRFIGYAVQSSLYCDFNICGKSSTSLLNG